MRSPVILSESEESQVRRMLNIVLMRDVEDAVPYISVDVTFWRFVGVHINPSVNLSIDTFPYTREAVMCSSYKKRPCKMQGLLVLSFGAAMGTECSGLVNASATF